MACPVVISLIESAGFHSLLVIDFIISEQPFGLRDVAISTSSNFYFSTDNDRIAAL
jgi:hypothetical protein